MSFLCNLLSIYDISIMIVQFLNGKQFETEASLEEASQKIVEHAEDLGLDLICASQIKFLTKKTYDSESESEDEDTIDEKSPVYAFIKNISEISFKRVLKDLSLYSDYDKRHKLLSDYIQSLADCDRITIFCPDQEMSYSCSGNLLYEIYDNFIQDEFYSFQRGTPLDDKEFLYPCGPQEEGWVHHWVRLEKGQLHAVATRVASR